MKNKQVHILSTKQLPLPIIKDAAKDRILIDCVSFIDVGLYNDDAIIIFINETLPLDAMVIFTSVNAVKAVAACIKRQPKWKVFCIDAATKETITTMLPLCKIMATANNSALLAEKIIIEKPENITFFCGNRKLDTIPEILATHNIHCKEICVYETRLTPVAVDKHYDGILFFSPTGVASFFMKNNIIPKTTIFSIGPTTTNALQLPTENIFEATSPDIKAMILLVKTHFFN